MAPLRIVVADDEPQVREYFRRILPRLGHECVAAAANGKELVESYRTLRPDLIITDINMSELNGIDAAKAIWQEQTVPIIFVSAFSDRKEQTWTADSDRHAAAFLLKPIKRQDLEAAIQKVIESKQGGEPDALAPG